MDIVDHELCVLDRSFSQDSMPQIEDVTTRLFCFVKHLLDSRRNEILSSCCLIGKEDCWMRFPCIATPFPRIRQASEIGTLQSRLKTSPPAFSFMAESKCMFPVPKCMVGTSGRSFLIASKIRFVYGATLPA